MSKGNLYFTRISVQKAPGIDAGAGFTITDLSRGINLVFGPNGSGKTTTALVIHELLWPGCTHTGGISAQGTYTADGRQISVSLDSGLSQKTEQPPEFGPSENRSRYLLALHELINSEDGNFARVVAAESQGGFDLDAAQEKLGFSGRILKNKTALARFSKAKDKVKEAEKHQKELTERHNSLSQLQNEYENLVKAVEQKQTIELAIKLKELEGKIHNIENDLHTFPADIGKLKGDEKDHLQKIAAAKTEAERTLLEAETELKTAETAIDKAQFHENTNPTTAIPVLTGLCSDLKHIEQRLERLEEQLAAAESGELQARKRIAGNLSEIQLQSLNTVEISDVSYLAKELVKLHSEKSGLVECERTLDGPHSEKIPEDLRVDDLKRAISALRRWLESTETPKTANGTLLWSTVLMVGLLGVVLAILYNPAWSALLLLPLVALFLNRTKRPSSDAQSYRDACVRDFHKSSLPPPSDWETAPVLERLEKLVGTYEQILGEKKRSLCLTDLRKQIFLLAEKENELISQRKALFTKLGLDTNTEFDDAWLPLLIQNISLWQKSRDTLYAKKEVLTELNLRKESLLRKISDNLKIWGYDKPDTSEQLSVFIDALSKRAALFNSATADKKRAMKTIDEQKKRLKQIEEERRLIFKNAGLEPKQEAVLLSRLEQLPEFNERTKKLQSLRLLIDNYLKDFPDGKKNTLLLLTERELKDRLKELEEKSKQAENLRAEIVRIEHDVENAKKMYDTSDALAELDAAQSELEMILEQDRTKAAREILVNWVRQEALGRFRPQVFERAKNLLSTFTRGKLLLSIDDRGAGSPKFLAAVDGRPPQPPENLSAGERVQLLMAVRMAFLEQNEPLRLPLLLDEALGTSDDLRAALIIDTVIKIAEQGRQVFYFTAQQDEIGKWKSRLAETNTEHKLIDLAEIRHAEAASLHPLATDYRVPAPPPPPEGLTHAEYGRILNVPGLDPMNENTDGVHLWHLVSDTSTLFKLLEYNITTWGQFRNLVDFGGGQLIEDQEVIERIEAAAKALETACEAWRTGRGKLVDTTVLQNSGVVSDRFINEVADLAKNCAGNAIEIIQKLRNHDVHAWRTTGTDALEAYFEENGYIPEGRVLSTEALRARTLASLSKEIRAGIIDRALIDRIIGSLPDPVTNQGAV